MSVVADRTTRIKASTQPLVLRALLNADSEPGEYPWSKQATVEAILGPERRG
jgi:hypothetical protein